MKEDQSVQPVSIDPPDKIVAFIIKLTDPGYLEYYRSLSPDDRFYEVVNVGGINDELVQDALVRLEAPRIHVALAHAVGPSIHTIDNAIMQHMTALPLEPESEPPTT